MDLVCVEGYDNCGNNRIILPLEFKLKSLKLYEYSNGKTVEIRGIQSNIENAKQFSVKRLNQVFNIEEFGELLQKNIEKSQDSSHYIIGENDQRLLIGPVLQVVNTSTFAKISESEVVFFKESPIDSNGKYVKKHIDRHKQIGVSVKDDINKDFIIFVLKNGCIVVKTGGYLFFDYPLVVVKSSGDYFTVSELNNKICAKSGVHLILLMKLKTPVPVMFLRKRTDIKTKQLMELNETEISEDKHLIESKQSLETLKQKSKLLVEPKEESIAEPQTESTIETKSESIVKASSESIAEPVVKSLTESVVKIERIVVSDLSDTKFIPDYIYDWIKSKGYELERGGGRALLSTGPTSVVRRGKRLSDSQRIAAKVIVSEMDEISRDYNKVPQEMAISGSVKHQNIIRTQDVLCIIAQMPNKMDKMYSIVIMELAPNDTLEKLLHREGKLSEERAKRIFRQIISAVVYLHNNNIAHSHLRLDNCLVFDNEVIKLCDFREAENTNTRVLVSAKRQRSYLTLKYMPPELFGNEKDLDLKKVDVWMCGCILYSLLTGNTSPFTDIDRNDTINETEKFKVFIKRQVWMKRGIEGINELGEINVTHNALDLLCKMFDTIPKNRITSVQVSQHKWLQ